jgi:xanthine dehydrogenase accessory factor
LTPERSVIAMDAEGQRLVTRLPDLLPAREKPAVLVTVWRTEGSAPRGPGARMLCRDGRLLAGTIGGGHLEEQALRDAQVLDDGHETHDADDAPALAIEVRDEADHAGRLARLCRYPLGAQLAQCCGGQVWLHFRRLDPAQARQLADDLTKTEALGDVLETRFGDEVLREQVRPLPTVLVCGAGHVAAALARVLQPLPWRVLVVDSRPEWADGYRFAQGTEVLCTEPLRLLAAWGWLGAEAQASQAAGKLSLPGRTLPRMPRPEATRALVMTHDHALDRELVAALLGCQQGQLAMVGLIGSPSKIRSTHQRLRQRGVPEAQLARLVGPIGLRIDGKLLGGKLPGEIAISIAAQLLHDRA